MLLSKATSIIGQVIIAWYLTREDFGLAAIAYMCSIVPLMIQQGGLREILIQRFRRFKLWAPTAFWLSMALGFAGGTVMAIIAPFAAAWYDEPRLVGLLLIIAVLFPMEAAAVIPLTRMQGDMRFRLIAAISLGQAVIQTVLSVILAIAGFGPFSLLLPRVVANAVAYTICWWKSPVVISKRIRIKRWRLLFGNGTMVVLATGCDYLLFYGGTFVLSIIADAKAVGLYYFAFNLSLQTLVLLQQSVASVLLPALSHLQDDLQRQAGAFLRTIGVLALIALPACATQAALASPGIQLVFPERWRDAIPLVQWLSVGMAVLAVGFPAVQLLQSQGRYGMRLASSVASVALFAILTVAGALWHGPLGMTIAYAAYVTLTQPALLVIAMRPAGMGFADLFHTLWRPAAIAVISGIMAWAAVELAARFLGGQSFAAQLAAGTLIAGATFFIIAPHLAPLTWNELWSRLRAIMLRQAT